MDDASELPVPVAMSMDDEAEVMVSCPSDMIVLQLRSELVFAIDNLNVSCSSTSTLYF
jgi:hypothetical protein